MLTHVVDGLGSKYATNNNKTEELTQEKCGEKKRSSKPANFPKFDTYVRWPHTNHTHTHTKRVGAMDEKAS